MEALGEDPPAVEDYRDANLQAAEFLINLPHEVIPQHGIGMTEDQRQEYVRLITNCDDAQRRLDESRN